MELADLEFGKRTLVFRQYTGAVLDTSKWSETHVSGGGGGGMSFQGGQGKTAPVSISSSTSTQHDIWIKDEETGKSGRSSSPTWIYHSGPGNASP